MQLIGIIVVVLMLFFGFKGCGSKDEEISKEKQELVEFQKELDDR
jgi:hypothetical protein